MLKNKVTYGQHLTYSDNFIVDPMDDNYGVDLDTFVLLRALRMLPGDGAHILENRPPTAEEVAQAPIFAYVPAGCIHS